ncbi:uncharacterized protein [Eurosta solidaginis]|uniref:uncharacterized protein n=1 Tax=Eurosta solidaginis TaxID=178769 RepID=UPI0035310772
MFIKLLAAIFVAAAILHATTGASLTDETQDNESLAKSARYGHNDYVRNWNQDDIDDEYDVYDLPKLAFALNKINKGDSQFFKKMVKLQIYLYKLFNDNNDVNHEYVFNVAYYFSKIKNDAFYAKLSSSTKSLLNDYIDNYLPPSAKTLFFDNSFRLMNREYDDKYLYTSNEKIDSARHYVFLSTKDNFNQNGKSEWTTTLKDASTNRHTNLKFTLQSVKTKHYAYVERNSYKGHRNLLASWNSSDKPSNADWTVTLYQDQLIFSQNGRVICASDLLKSDSRRYVHGEDENGEAVAACQWFAKECP